MMRSKPCETLMEPIVKLTVDKTPFSDPHKYIRLVEKLNYLIVTRPDIAFPIGVVIQFMPPPTDTH